ncbi:unnamed protein product [Caenorhabditis nigoni]
MRFLKIGWKIVIKLIFDGIKIDTDILMRIGNISTQLRAIVDHAVDNDKEKDVILQKDAIRLLTELVPIFLSVCNETNHEDDVKLFVFA